MLIGVVIQSFILARTLMLSSTHGASARLDSFYLANNFTVVAFNIVSAGITTVLIPQLARGDSRRSLRRFAQSVSLACFGLSILLLAVAAASRPLLGAAASGEVSTPFLMLVFVLLLGQQFRAATAVLVAVMQSGERFIAARLATIVPAALPVAYLAFRSDLLGFCVATVVAYCLEFAITRVLQRSSSRANEKPGTDHTERGIPASVLWTSAAPVVASSALFQVQMLAMTALVGHFGAGTITIYSNASQLVSMVQILLIQNLVTLCYPRLASWTHQNASLAMRRLPGLIGLTNAAVFMVIALYLGVGATLLEFLFLRGNFHPEAVSQLVVFGLLLLAGLPLSTIRDFLYRVLYARGAARAAAKNAVTVIGFNFVAVLLLLPWFGVYAVFMALIAGGVVSLAGVSRALKGADLRITWAPLLQSHLGYFMAAACSGGLMHWVSQHWTTPVASLAIAGVGAGIYLVLASPWLVRDARRAGLRS